MRNFRIVDGDNDFAANLIRHVIRGTESGHLADAIHRKPGLFGTGLVVEAAVEDAAVVAGLMLSDVGLLFEDDDFSEQPAFTGFKCRSKADDASPDDAQSPVSIRSHDF
jgi:hypothetical protein